MAPGMMCSSPYHHKVKFKKNLLQMFKKTKRMGECERVLGASTFNSTWKPLAFILRDIACRVLEFFESVK